MTKPIAVLDPQWRQLDELFTTADLARLGALCDLVWAKNEPMPKAVLDENLAKMSFFLSAQPVLDAGQIKAATNLKAVIELYGAFPDTIDYDACFDSDVAVLATGPGMRGSVAEMAVAMALAGARGMVEEHELFRTGGEHWLNDNPATDFTLFEQAIGFVGFGAIAKECCRLLAPFAPKISAYDPWLDPSPGPAASCSSRPRRQGPTRALSMPRRSPACRETRCSSWSAARI
jgi:phosphoglycerate dehydrogenase-like enzyme